MNHPQHIFNDHDQVLYLRSDGHLPLGLTTGGRPRMVKATSSWALNSRLNRLKKRHSPPTSKSLPTETRREKRIRSSKSKVEQRPVVLDKQPLLATVGQSRWESSTCPQRMLSSSANYIAPLKKATGRPSLPKRQKSLDHSNESGQMDSQTRCSKITNAVQNDKNIMRSFRRSFQSEATTPVNAMVA